MDIRTIKALARILQESGLTVLEVKDGETQIRLEGPGSYAPVPAECATPQESGPARDEQEQGVDFNELTLVESPIVGVFYSAPGPGQSPFVDIGSRVKKGDVLCIIEAMKLMNEITAEQDGEIADICVADGDVVEFGQPLFKIF